MESRQLLRLTISGIALAFTVSLTGGCGGNDSADTETDQTAAAETSAQTTRQSSSAPYHFAAMDTQGQERHSSEWIGKKPVVLNFWGTWCPPCRKEIPELVKLYDEFKGKGVEMVGLAVRDTPTKVETFTDQRDMNWVMLMANQEVLKKYNVTVGIPTTIFLDKNGEEVARFVGPRSFETFKKAAEAALASA